MYTNRYEVKGREVSCLILYKQISLEIGRKNVHLSTKANIDEATRADETY